MRFFYRRDQDTPHTQIQAVETAPTANRLENEGWTECEYQDFWDLWSQKDQPILAQIQQEREAARASANVGQPSSRWAQQCGGGGGNGTSVVITAKRWG